MTTPAESLKDLALADGWVVTEKITNDLPTGGNHCIRYKVVHPSGKTGFLKAMDLAHARSVASQFNVNFLEVLNTMTGDYIHERKIVKLCGDKNLSRITVALAAGEIEVCGFNEDMKTVFYLIFEDSKDGDLRSSGALASSDLNQVARIMHSAALALRQIQSIQLSHHDIKPSNVLSFGDQIFKLSDFGQAATPIIPSRWDDIPYTGDPSYQPPEVGFEAASAERWDRSSIDVYMLGSLHYHLITGAQIVWPLLRKALEIEPSFRKLSYSEALPYLISAHTAVMDEFKKTYFTDQKLAEKHARIIKELCNPDFKIRGNPSKQKNSAVRLSADRYIGLYSELIRATK